MSYNILIAGIGGQGTILASRLLAEAAILTGKFARTGETIGMSQRGGCVVSHVRIDSESVSPYIPMGSADLIIAFEYAEGARNICRKKDSGKIIVNTQKVKPVTVTLGGMEYNEEKIKKALSEAIFIDGYELAKNAGNVKTINVVLLGCALGANLLPFTMDDLKKAIDIIVPDKLRILNHKALEMGFDYVQQNKKGI